MDLVIRIQNLDEAVYISLLEKYESSYSPDNFGNIVGLIEL